MAKVKEKKEALILRKKGESIKQIAKQLCISRSTASTWCREVTLTSRQQKLLRVRMIQGGNEGRTKGKNSNIIKRQNSITLQEGRARKILGQLSERDITMIGLGLYWGEGSKKNERRFIFTNSDEVIIRCMIKWLLLIGTPRSELVGQIYINEQHNDRLKKVETFWLQKLDIEKGQLRKSVLIKTPHKKYYANRESYFGTFRLMVKKSSTIQYLTIGLLGIIGSQV
jgi:hypothetical protein